MSLKDDLELNKPRRTPGHATKSHVVKTNVDGKPKMIRFGEQGAKTAGAPSSNDSAADKAKRKSFKARHASNIAKGPASAAYWADRVKWDKGGPVNFRSDQPVRPGIPFLNTAADVTADTLSGMLGPIVGSAYSLGNQYFTDKSIEELEAEREAVNAALNYTPRTEEGQAASDYAMGKLGEGVTFLAEKYNENRDSLGPIPGMIDYGMEQYNTLDPETRFAIGNALTVGEVVPIGKVAGMAKRGVQGAVDTRRINRAADLVPDESEYLPLQDRLEAMGARQNRADTDSSNLTKTQTVDALTDQFKENHPPVGSFDSATGKPVTERIIKSRANAYAKKLKVPAVLRREAYTLGKKIQKVESQERRIINPEELIGKTGVPVVGDRSARIVGDNKADRAIVDIRGVPLSSGHIPQGGFEYSRDHGGWASMSDAAKKKQANFVTAQLASGSDDILGIYSAMGREAINFSVDALIPMIKQLPAIKIPKKDIKAFDAAIRKGVTVVKIDKKTGEFKATTTARPDWLGLEHPEVIDQLIGQGDFPREGTGATRKIILEEMVKKKWENLGFPVYDDVVETMTAPELSQYKTAETGLTMFKADPFADTSPSSDHLSYDTDIPGEYFGGLFASIPPEIMYPDMFKMLSQKMTDPKSGAKPRPLSYSDQTGSLMMDPKLYEVYTPEKVENIIKYLNATEGTNYAEGGEVEVAEEVVEYNADRISQIARDIQGYAGGGLIEKAIQKGADALGFGHERQVAISQEAVDLTNEMVDAGLVPEQFRVELVMPKNGSNQTRQNTGIRGDEEVFNAVNHALFSYDAGQSKIAAVASQAKELYQGAKKKLKGGDPKSEYLDYFNNKFGFNLAEQGLSRREAKDAIINSIGNIDGKGVKGRNNRGEELIGGEVLVTNAEDIDYAFSKGGDIQGYAPGGLVEDIYQPEDAAQVFGDVVMDTVSGVAGPIAAAAASLGNQYFTDKSIDQLEAEKAAMNEAMNYSPRTAGGRAINQGAMNLLDKGMTAGINMATSYPGPVKDLVESRLAEYGLEKYQDLDPETKFALGNVLEAGEALPIGMANRGIRNAIDTRRINTAAGNVPDDSAYLDLQDRLEEMGARQTSVKEKGGNWLQGKAARSSRAAYQLERFKVHPILAPGVMQEQFKIVYPDISTEEAANMERAIRQKGLDQPDAFGGEIVTKLGFLREDYPEVFNNILDAQYSGGLELNNWIDNTLSRYVETEMGTPGDPVKAMAGRGDPLHVTRDVLNYNANMYDSKYDPEQRDFNVPSSVINEGLDLQSLPLAQTWEGASDRAFEQLPAGSLLGKSTARITDDNPWLSKVPPETPVNFLRGTGEVTNDLGFRELTSGLFNAMRTDSPLPANLRLDKNKLKKLTVPQAMERVANINQWKAREALAKEKAMLMKNIGEENTRVVDETFNINFAEKKGGTWVDLPDVMDSPDAMQSCTMIGKAGGWCTMEEGVAEDYSSGPKQLTTLLDADGRPHVQIMENVENIEFNPDMRNAESPDFEIDEIKPIGNSFSSKKALTYAERDPLYRTKVSLAVEEYLNKISETQNIYTDVSNDLQMFEIVDLKSDDVWESAFSFNNRKDLYKNNEPVQDAWEVFLGSSRRFMNESEVKEAVNKIVEMAGGEDKLRSDWNRRLLAGEFYNPEIGFAKGGAVNAKYDADKINKIAKSIMAENFAEGGPAIYNPSRINEIANRILQEA